MKRSQAAYGLTLNIHPGMKRQTRLCSMRCCVLRTPKNNRKAGIYIPSEKTVVRFQEPLRSYPNGAGVACTC